MNLLMLILMSIFSHGLIAYMFYTKGKNVGFKSGVFYSLTEFKKIINDVQEEKGDKTS